ncbi:hypothetical protein [Marisediminicola sp. LYQ134]|uniref:hypothetical protein n=1 Tax=Marisediminicola sp. LYQ134 TaxID=3391061 RepID=UPI003983422E
MSTAASALWASIVRTIVPTIVGAVIAFFVGRGITLDSEFEVAFTTLLNVGFAAIYYIAVRLLETYVAPKLGWLLGLAKTPAVYTADSPANPDHSTPGGGTPLIGR